MTKAFCDTAKNYVQISSAALALPLLFTQAMLGKSASDLGIRHAPGSLVTAWILFGTTIVFGLTYKWLSVRRVWDQFHETYRTTKNAQRPGYRRTWWIIKLGDVNLAFFWFPMVCSFYAGIGFFIYFAADCIRTIHN